MILLVKIAILMSAGLVAYRWSTIGVALLLLLSCSFGFVTELSAIILPSGSIDARDIAMIILFVKTIASSSFSGRDKAFSLCLAMALWLSLCALTALFFDQIGLREAYRLIFKIAIFWMLPITVRQLDLTHKKQLLSFSLGLAAIVAGVQLFALLTANLSLLSQLYPMDSWEVYGYACPEDYYADIYRTGLLPRMYIPGDLFVRMVFGFSVCLIVIGNRHYRLHWLLLVSLLTGLFTVSLGGRSDAAFIIVVVLCSVMVLFVARKKVQGSRNGFLILASVFLLFALSVTLVESGTGQPILTQVMDRWSLRGFGLDEDVRIEDTIEAWTYLLRSPLWGIGSSKVHWEPVMITYGGQDVHPFVSQGLIGGFPAIVLLLLFIFVLYRALRIRLRDRSPEEDHYYALAAVPPLVGAFMLSAINTTPVFLYSAVQVPLGIFGGILLSRVETRK